MKFYTREILRAKNNRLKEEDEICAFREKKDENFALFCREYRNSVNQGREIKRENRILCSSKIASTLKSQISAYFLLSYNTIINNISGTNNKLRILFCIISYTLTWQQPE